MKYLPRKLIREEIDKVNPKLNFKVALSHNRFGLFGDKSYVIKILYKKFGDIYCLIITIRRSLVKSIDKKTLRSFLHNELIEINEKFNTYKGRKKIKRRTVESEKEWRYVPELE